MNHSGPQSNKTQRSLGSNLLFWFLLLTFLPLTITVWLDYRRTVSSLQAVAIEKLEQGAELQSKFIHNWFDYRFMDLKYFAENQRNSDLLLNLTRSRSTRGDDVKTFVKSHTWKKLVENRKADLSLLKRHYDYIRDIYLIDTQGNILFTVAQKDDLGTNLFSGPLANTRFSRTAKYSLLSGQILFSDLERYSASNNNVTGFLTAPIFDNKGNAIGIFAVQVLLERINNLMTPNSNSLSLRHYLIGEDGLLRTPLFKNSQESVLSQQINTKQFQYWSHHEDFNAKNHNNNVFEYRGPLGKFVFGLHQGLKLPGTNWIMISEIDQDEALTIAYKTGKATILLFLFTAIFAAGLAFYQSRRITRPIIQLANASKAVAAGETGQYVEITSNDEIGIMAKSFNYMLKMRQAHEQALLESSQEAKKAYANLANQKFALDQHSIVEITDIRGTITFVNDRFLDLSGYTREELLGKNHRILNSGLHDREFFRNMFLTISKGRVWHGEIRNKRKNGGYYWVDTTVVPFMGENGKPENYIAIRSDITERKRYERELLEAKEAAETATQQKSLFLANMSHEIRTPMNGIIGMTSLMLDSNLNSRQRSFANATMVSADALLNIINDILDFSKIEAGKLELDAVPFDLLSLVEDVAELMALKCRDKNIEMFLRYKPDTKRFVVGDPGRVRQVILNLVSNAIKFTENGYILLSVESYEENTELEKFQISIEDSGIGIASDKLDHIFNKFNQEDPSTTRKYGGTGLGLAICRQLCSLMNGDIQVDSIKGKGSTFTFTMVLQISDADPTEEKTNTTYRELRGLRALIVDSLPITRDLLGEQLSTLDIEIDKTHSQDLAIEHLKQGVLNNKPFDIVFVDYHEDHSYRSKLVSEISKNELLTEGALILITSAPIKENSPLLDKGDFDGIFTHPLHPSELFQMLSILWEAKKNRKNISAVTRFTLQEALAAGRKKYIFNNTNILLVEDNPINVMVATELLEGSGCKVTPAGNGLEAVRLIKEIEFDLIFMDCQMPEMDGFEATREIRKYLLEADNKYLPVIALTANAMKSDKEKCLSSGMDDYLSKPVNIDTLEHMLVKWLPNRVSNSFQVDTISSTDAPIQLIDASDDNTDILDYAIIKKLKILFGNKFSSSVELHINNARENIKRIELAIHNNDFESLERAAHSMKGASAQFGVIHLNTLAKELENIAKSRSLESTDSLLNKLRDAQQQATVALRQQVDTFDEAATKAS